MRETKSEMLRALEKLTVGKLFVTLVVVIAFFSVIYFLLGYLDEGIVSTAENDERASYWDCLYFSVITVSSLGYGDYKPIGMSRIFAGIEVLFGLVFIALLVCQLASKSVHLLAPKTVHPTWLI